MHLVYKYAFYHKGKGTGMTKRYSSDEKEILMEFLYDKKLRLRAIWVLVGLGMLLVVPFTYGESYNYISAFDLKKRIESGAQVFLLDIQVEKEYSKHHIVNTFATYAYPVESIGDRAKLKSALGKIRNSKEDIIIICPRGAGGAKRTYDYLQAEGIVSNRLYILEKGQSGWPYPELIAATK